MKEGDNVRTSLCEILRAISLTGLSGKVCHTTGRKEASPLCILAALVWKLSECLESSSSVWSLLFSGWLMRDEVFLAYSKRPNGQRGLDKEKEESLGSVFFVGVHLKDFFGNP